jgi:predicted ATPase
MGKTSIINQLQLLGFKTIQESGRQIIKEQMRTGGTKLPWIDQEAFAREMLHQSLEEYRAWLDSPKTVFFDRGIPDVVGYLNLCNLTIPDELHQLTISCRYNTTVFITPPWEEIFANDTERKQSFSEAIATYDVMLKVYEQLRYHVVPVPKMSIQNRADFILTYLDL